MYNQELLDTIKEQGKGVLLLRRDYKIVFDNEKKLNKDYKYSIVYSVVYDGKDNVKITYSNFPCDSVDFLRRYTNLKDVTVKLDAIKNLTFKE